MIAQLSCICDGCSIFFVCIFWFFYMSYMFLVSLDLIFLWWSICPFEFKTGSCSLLDMRVETMIMIVCVIFIFIASFRARGYFLWFLCSVIGAFLWEPLFVITVKSSHHAFASSIILLITRGSVFCPCQVSTGLLTLLRVCFWRVFMLPACHHFW